MSIRIIIVACCSLLFLNPIYSQKLRSPRIEKGVEDVLVKEVGFEKDYFYIDLFYDYNDYYSTTMSFDPKNPFFIRDLETNKDYKIINRLPTQEDNYKISSNAPPTFRLKFEKIPPTVKKINLLQGSRANGWNFYGIDLADLTKSDKERIKIYNGFFIKKVNTASREGVVTTAFLNVEIDGDNLEFDFDFFDSNQKRKSKTVVYKFSSSPNPYPYKKIRHASNNKYWNLNGNYDQFQYWLGKDIEFEYLNNDREIHGHFKEDHAQFYLIETGKRLKLSKKVPYFTGTVDNDSLKGVGFYLGLNKDKIIDHCIFSNFESSGQYNGYTIYIDANAVYRGNALKGTFDNYYSVDYFNPCYFRDYDHQVIRWEVLQKTGGSIPAGAYGYNCDGKIARKCDSNFKNCQQLIDEKKDYSLLYALGALAGMATVGIHAVASTFSHSTIENKTNVDCDCTNPKFIEDNDLIGPQNNHKIQFDNFYRSSNIKIENGKYVHYNGLGVVPDRYNTYAELLEQVIKDCKSIRCR